MIVIGLQEYRPSVIVVGPVAVQSWSAEGMPRVSTAFWPMVQKS